MAQFIKLVKTPAKPGVKDSGYKLMARNVSQGKTNLAALCQLISARSSISSADVKAVLDSLNFVMDYELKQGRIVQFDSFGNFRLSVSSDRVDEKKDFDTSLLRKPKIVFTPSGSLQETRKTVKFSLQTDEETDPEEGDDKPEL
ncbi:HU family DNA-binding protein [Parabacteroides sp. Marseille-P3160]|uniref:HU family DNA-binding protein n=1 Tax=Parabacteroides sp. Marseille-P3160 TaxID=1917887 RepID=UPI0009B9838F|nr:HU family DNA-binding protein [Parabacteroides sp. Marseille-P3160]